MTDEPIGQFYEPQDRFTRMGDLLTEVLPQLDEYQEGDRCIVFMTDHVRSGITIHGYDDDAIEAIADLFVHLKSIMKANGSDLEFIGIPNSPEGLEE